MRRQLLALDAARYGDRDLSAWISAVPVEGEPAARWGVDWASGSDVDDRFRCAFTGHTGWVPAVATGVMDGRTIVVTGSRDKSVRVWDLTSGKQIGKPLTGHDGEVWAVATEVVDGRPIAVSGSWDGTVRVWDLITHRQRGPALTFPAPIHAVAVTPHNTHLTVTFGHDVATLSPR
ncbi:hypothetical protein [Streptomyces sp. TE33382]